MPRSPRIITPMMKQYLKIKQEYPDALLFYRMGDFYEMFFDDAIAAAAALDITLTHRGKHQGKNIPMCGVPHHAADSYFSTLIRKRFRVAVCEQLESPQDAKKRGVKSIVKRGVVRLVTPGTLTEDSLLDSRQHNYLCACVDIRGEFATAWCDVSTGDFFVQSHSRVTLGQLLAQLYPREILLTPALSKEIREVIGEFKINITKLSSASFDSNSAQERLYKLFKVQSLDGFGHFSQSELAAMGAIIDYLAITQKGKLPILRPPIAQRFNTTVQIDVATRRNLEITRNLADSRKNTVLNSIDRTLTGSGARLLQSRLSAPSTEINVINDRLDAIKFFIASPLLVTHIRRVLKSIPDSDRALSRISLTRGGPRDLIMIRQSLHGGAQLGELLLTSQYDIPKILAQTVIDLRGHKKITEQLFAAVIDSPPLLIRDGNFIAAEYDADLDATRKLRDEGRKVISRMQVEYADHTGISVLKIKHNRVLGYFIETPSSHASKMMSNEWAKIYIHRQTTANTVRFTTVELSELENRILNASNAIIEIEKDIFHQLCQIIIEYADNILLVSKAIAEIDIASSLVNLAKDKNWVRPFLTTDRSFKIIGGRHPVVEVALQYNSNQNFIANDCDLSAKGDQAKPLWLVTGPNMAGKSTFLRQNALIVILAQMGCYVPAKNAKIGIVTQLFSRIGASDNLARGQSTFMIEMVETAAILHQADEKAMVILDEIGRGTATYDGLSIAWATLEHLHNVNKCRTLFATHYHELTALADSLKGLKNTNIRVREWQGDIIFLYEVTPGIAERSYGVQVAKLAGLPHSVIKRAQIILAQLEKKSTNPNSENNKRIDNLPLFDANIEQPPANKSEVEIFLQQIFPDDLTPKAALELIYELKDKL